MRAFIFLLALCHCYGGHDERKYRPTTGGSVAEGKIAIAHYGCVACHTISGIPGPTAQLGPPLTGFAQRGFIAGQLANTTDNLVRWIVDPQAINPKTAMPKLGVDAGTARDMAAYLYSRD